MAKFEIGEVAIIVRTAPEFEHILGEEVEILDIVYTPSINEACYKFHLEGFNSSNLVAEESILRKKKPPEELTTWKEVQQLTNWNPTKAKHATN